MATTNPLYTSQVPTATSLQQDQTSQTPKIQSLYDSSASRLAFNTSFFGTLHDTFNTGNEYYSLQAFRKFIKERKTSFFELSTSKGSEASLRQKEEFFQYQGLQMQNLIELTYKWEHEILGRYLKLERPGLVFLRTARPPLETSKLITTESDVKTNQEALAVFYELCKQRASYFDKLMVESKYRVLFFRKQAMVLGELQGVCTKWQCGLDEAWWMKILEKARRS
ncbi:MAG: hypothetical protein Q9221_003231 [Calogaya cf. arnoldii]